jgi:ribose transport system substrate-binding protein
MPRRHLFLILLAGCLAWLPGPALAGKKPTVTIVLKSLRNEYFTMMIRGAELHHAQHAQDYQLNIEGVQRETDVKGQEAIIKRHLASHDEALIIAPADSKALLPLLSKAIANKTIIINLDNKMDERSLVEAGLNIPFVGPSNFNGARMVGEYVLNKIKPGSKVGIIEGLAESINAKSRSDGYRQAIASSKMKLVGMRSGYWEINGGYQAALELIKANPDIAALLCGNDNMALGAVKALQERQLLGKVAIGGYDNIPAIHPYLANKQILATADQHPELQTAYAIELALNALKKSTPQSDIPPLIQTPVKLISLP